MAAGTVVSGGFPGLVAQEVQPNPKCNGCLHFDGQGGKTGICSIGTKPWNCGDGDHADTGYAPIARGAGKHLPDMNTHGAHAHDVDAQEVGGLYGAGSTRAVVFQQVSLSEEHVHFAKSIISKHEAMQKSMCRLCSMSSAIGMSPANTGPQVCTCEPLSARTVAKSLAGQLSNLQGEVIDLDDLTAFVYDAAKANFNPQIVKGTFYHAHGKYEVSPAGGGKHHVDFHPKGGGASARVGTYDSPRDARSASNVHARRFASGTGADNDPEKTAKHKKVNTSAFTMPHLMAKKSEDEDEEIGKSLGILHESDHGTYHAHPVEKNGQKIRVSYHPGGKAGAHFGTFDNVPEARAAVKQHAATMAKVSKSENIKIPRGPISEAAIHATGVAHSAGTRGAHTKARNAHVKAAAAHGEGYARKFHEAHAQYHAQVLHSGDVKGGHTEKSEDENDVEKGDAPRHPHDLKVGDLVTHSSSTGFHHPDPKVAATHGQIAQVSSIKNHPHSGEPTIHVRYHDSSGKMSKQHLLSGYDSTRHPTTEDMQHHSKTLKRHFNAKAKLQNAAAPTTEKSLGGEVDDTVLTAETIDTDDGISKSLRWSHKTPGQASTSHGKYHVTKNAGGGHTVTYHPKGSDKAYTKTFASHREALGAVTEHHLKNRPAPKPRKKKDPNAPKAPKVAAAPAGGCPPCP